MNGFSSKVVCKNSSVTIWKILFNITIPIIHHKLGGWPQQGRDLSQQHIVMINPPGLIITGKPLWYTPQAYCNGGLIKTLHQVAVAEWLAHPPTKQEV